MTRIDQYGHLLPLSKTRCLSIETTLVSLRHPEASEPIDMQRQMVVSPIRHPKTIKSDDVQRPTWSSALFVEDSTSIDRDYFSLHFHYPETIESDKMLRQIWSFVPFCRRLNVFRPRPLLSPSNPEIDEFDGVQGL